MSLRDWFRKPLDEEFKKKFVEKAAWNAKVFFSIIVLFVLFIFVLMMNERFHIFQFISKIPKPNPDNKNEALIIMWIPRTTST